MVLIIIAPEVNKQNELGEIDTVDDEMMKEALHKAQQELSAKFDYASLCNQGKQLYEMVLLDKTKRIRNKLKYRAKKRAPQPRI